jgi:sulfite exporter TauE/SafE
MCNCSDSISQLATTVDFVSISQLIFNIVVFGITSSFTHCIGMCGGIAMGQSALRMIESQGKPSRLQKIIASVSWEYYIGKAVTYSLLTLAVMSLGKLFKGNLIFNFIKTTLLSIVIIYLLLSGLKVIYKIFGKNLNQLPLFEVFYPTTKLTFIKNKTISKIIIGIFLGLIPCGAVYSAISIIVSGTENSVIGPFLAFLFGLTTFPGLFILSYMGNIFFHRYDRFFNIIYLLTVIWNVRFLVNIM